MVASFGLAATFNIGDLFQLCRSHPTYADPGSAISNETVQDEAARLPMLDKAIQDEVTRLPMLEEAIQDEVARLPMLDEVIQDEAARPPMLDELNHNGSKP